MRPVLQGIDIARFQGLGRFQSDWVLQGTALAGGPIGLGRSRLVGNRTRQGSVSWIGRARLICRGLCDSQFHWGRVASKVAECLAGEPTVRSVSLGEVAYKATEPCRRPR